MKDKQLTRFVDLIKKAKKDSEIAEILVRVSALASQELECKHYFGEGYSYTLQDSKLFLCPQCNLDLSIAVAKQVVLEALIPSMEKGKSNGGTI